MSSLGQLHSEISGNIAYFEKECGVKLPFDVQETDVWSYGRLAKTLICVGCEVLMIDAEGHHERILKSLLQHCEEDPRAWPQVIQFETMGHCDQLKDHSCEREMTRLLKAAGYLLAGYSNKDSYLLSSARASVSRLKSWLWRWQCYRVQQEEEVSLHHHLEGHLLSILCTTTAPQETVASMRSGSSRQLPSAECSR